MTKRLLLLSSLILAIASWGSLAFAADARGKQVDFIHEVQPIFKEACYSCHGPQKSKGGLRLDIKARAFKGGENGAVIVPGAGEKSVLVTRLTSAEPDERMPQKADPLPPEKIKLIRDWIDQGANWPEAVAGADPAHHWAFQPLTHPQPPAVRKHDWVKTPIDQFVLAKLEEKKIAPNGPVSRRKLIRRAYLDLVGVPPEPQEVEAFLADRSANAYEKVVDRLLANPHYGERWARHWLDAARFAESDGFEQDTDRPNAYWYRDFVIKALDDDMPYDQFVRWQIAGDEFAPDNPWAMAATGFLGAEQFPTQLTEAEFEQARYDELDNMTATTGTAMLGLTVGCARCHDHKYDPISNQEYYRLVATFTTTIRSDTELEFNHERYLRAKAAFDAAHAPLTEALKAFEHEQLPARLARWAESYKPGDVPTTGWVLLEPSTMKSKGGATFTRQEDGSLLAGGTNPDFDTYTFVAATTVQKISALRVEALAHSSMTKSGPGRAGNGNFDLTDLLVTAAPASGSASTNQPMRLKLVNPRSTFDQGTNLSVALVIDGDKKTGWAIDPQFGKDQAAVFDFEQPVGFEGGTVFTITLDFQGNNQHAIGRPRLSVTAQPSPAPLSGEPEPQSLATALARLAEKSPLSSLTDEQRAALVQWYRNRDPEWQRLNAAVAEHLKQAPKPERKKVMVTSEGLPPIPHFADGRGFPHFYPQTYFLKRGDATKKGEVATQGFLKILERTPEGEKHWQEPKPEDQRTSYRRRAMANWMTDTRDGAGELLARVIVNRLWHHHFGRGIVGTPNDFGLQGDRPTHPELLDWLAADCIQNGWRLKRVHKLIMMSATYQEAADIDPAREGLDRENRLLWHWPRRRLEAEAIRDSILSVTGELDPTMFGPGSLQADMGRRSVYFFIKRSQLIPALMLFDFPEPNTSVGGRVRTTVAPQALAAMNSPQVRAYARAFAHRLAPQLAGGLAQAINQAYKLALGREPLGGELKDAKAFITNQTVSYQQAKQTNAAELALADFCQVLLGLNEFIYLE